jgi:hypothetical protein
MRTGRHAFDAFGLFGIFRLLTLFLLLGGLAVYAEEEEEEGEPLHPTDLALLTRIGKALPPKGPIATFETALGAELDEARKIGFGGEIRKYVDFGERVSVWIDVLAFEGRVAAVRIRAPDIPPGRGRKHALALLGEGAEPTASGIAYRHETEKEFAAYRSAVTSELGTPTLGAVPAQDRKAVAELTDPLAGLTFGTACYEDGGPPDGRLATDSLRLRAALPALDHVVRGLNAEGRVYAAQALLVLQREGVHVPPDLEEAADRVYGLEVPIEACSGCFVFHDTAEHLLSGPHRVGNVACSLLERVHDGEQWQDVGKIIVYWDGTWVWRRRTGDGDAEPTWKRGRLPHDIHDALFATLRNGDGLMVRLGTPIYDLHLDDTRTKHPEGIAKLHAHVLGTLPQDGE